MDDPLRVGGVERASQLTGDPDQRRRRSRPRSSSSCCRFLPSSSSITRNGSGAPGVLVLHLRVDDADDVARAQRRGRARLAQEPLRGVRLGRDTPAPAS